LVPIGMTSRSLALALLLSAYSSEAIIASDESTSRAPTACAADSPQLPATIELNVHLRAEAESMLRRSPTFRQQCRRISRAASLRIFIDWNAALAERSFRARSVIERTRAGEIRVFVEISPHGSPIEWISHEFEHVLEQLEGLRLPELAGVSPDVWRSSEGMYETERAIRAGRRVREEMARQPRHADKLVQ
jgi:hypothetical protein